MRVLCENIGADLLAKLVMTKSGVLAMERRYPSKLGSICLGYHIEGDADTRIMSCERNCPMIQIGRKKDQ